MSTTTGSRTARSRSPATSSTSSRGRRMRYRVGVDIGGTFTDMLVTDESGEARLYKSPTTPRDPSIGVLQTLERAARDAGLLLDGFLSQVDAIVHGTTITTNAVLTGDGARAGFVTTKGFR